MQGDEVRSPERQRQIVGLFVFSLLTLPLEKACLPVVKFSQPIVSFFLLMYIIDSTLNNALFKVYESFKFQEKFYLP